ncbi:hypothetical protein CFOL_v3_09252 [Cephalotus follicularis]|uniref:Uncharacterized protein n=1 Tax=Cephalotus follicularis TaxID=3775 RepID=A0A1Q3BCQ9_CEPFO|nr:hypothetical protein CFOL_v3_09252 [Cephalotus follicularis]
MPSSLIKTQSSSSLQIKPRDQIPTDAPPSELHALIRNKRHPTQRATEIEMIKPPIEAHLVEHVATIQLANMVELFGEDDEAGKARAHGAQEVAVDLSRAEAGEAHGMEKAQEGGPKVTDAVGD